MLTETHPALPEPPRPPAVCGEGERSVKGCWRDSSGSDSQVPGAKPQRGPGERADTLLQDTSRHDGEKLLVAPGVQGEEETGSRAPVYACVMHKLVIKIVLLFFYFIFAVSNRIY